MSEGGGSITSHVRLKEQWNILKEETCKKRDFEQFGPSNVIIFSFVMKHFWLRALKLQTIHLRVT